MGLIGIIIASVVSMFWHPTILTVLINYLGAFIFIGLTAYDTQRLKAMALQTQNDGRMAARLSVTGALMLYLDFLNLPSPIPSPDASPGRLLCTGPPVHSARIRSTPPMLIALPNHMGSTIRSHI